MTTEDSEIRECYDCGESTCRRFLRAQRFEYYNGVRNVVLTADVPVWECSECGAITGAGEGEIIRQEAVCRYLGRLAPREIVDLRARLKLTQSDLAELSGLDEASIMRWESGSLIQNESADRMLRLLVQSAAQLEELFHVKQAMVAVHPRLGAAGWSLVSWQPTGEGIWCGIDYRGDPLARISLRASDRTVLGAFNEMTPGFLNNLADILNSQLDNLIRAYRGLS